MILLSFHLSLSFGPLKCICACSGFPAPAVIKHPVPRGALEGQCQVAAKAGTQSSSNVASIAHGRGKQTFIAWLLVLSRLLHSLLLLGPPAQGQGAAHSGLGLPTSVTNQDSPSQTCSQDNLKLFLR